MKYKLQIICIALLILNPLISVSNAQIGNDLTYQGWYLTQDEGFGIKLNSAKINGTEGMPINLIDPWDETSEFEATLYPGDIMGLGELNVTPDWDNNPEEEFHIGGRVHGGLFHVMYPAPWSLNPNNLQGEGPLMFWPIIPYGEDSYYTELGSLFQTSGFQIQSNSTVFEISFSNSSYSASMSYDKTTGLMSSYYFDGTFGATSHHIEAEYAWMLAPSKVSSLDWYTQYPVIDYLIETASQSDGTPGVPVNIEPNPGPHQPLDGHGIFYEGEFMRSNIYNLRGFDSQPGYMLELESESARVIFNISIELPSADPSNNTTFIYPMFPVTDFELVEGYFGYAETVSDMYEVNYDGNFVTLTLSDGNITIQATWNYVTGFLTHWSVVDPYGDGPGFNLEFSLLAANGLEYFDIGFAAEVGNGATYLVDELLINNSNTMDFENGNGYIAEGDRVYFEPTEVGNQLVNGPPVIIYSIYGTNGQEDNVNFSMSYPLENRFSGPPYLYPHFLLGNSVYFEWLDTLFEATGAVFTYNSSYIQYHFENQISSDNSVYVDVVWRASDGVMLTYDVEVHEGDVLSVLKFHHIADGNTVNETETSDEPAFITIFTGTDIAIITTLVAVMPILLKKRKIKI